MNKKKNNIEFEYLTNLLSYSVKKKESRRMKELLEALTTAIYMA